MSGYFTDGTISVELGEYVFATPATQRPIAQLDPPGLPASLLDAGGGVVEVNVTAQRLRANLGDAERYGFELLQALATSGAGELGIEDARGNRYTLSDAACVSGSARVEAFRLCSVDLTFQAPQAAAAPDWTTPPAPPAEWPGTATLQDYAAGGVDLGIGGSMDIEMVRSWPSRMIPRARGARMAEPPSGASLSFLLHVHAKPDSQSLPAYLQETARHVGPRAVDLTANGNTYSDVLLRGLWPDHADRGATSFRAEFVKEL